jgi:hypothetical protein
LGPELLFSIACHLKPRHLYKLMQTSKTIKAAVDTEEYWARVAVHIVLMQFRWNDEFRSMGRLPATIRYLVNDYCGYSKSIDCCINAMRAFMKNGLKDHPGTSLVWKQLVNAPVSVLVMAGYSAICAGVAEIGKSKTEYYSQNKARTPKDVVKIEVMYEKKKEGTNNYLLVKFQNDLDDDTSFSRNQKAKIGGMIARLIGEFEYGENEGFVSMDDILFCFRNFSDENM